MELEQLNRLSPHEVFYRIDTDADGQISVRQLCDYIDENVDHRLSRRLVDVVRRRNDGDMERTILLDEFVLLSNEPEVRKIVTYMKKSINGYVNMMVPRAQQRQRKFSRSVSVEVDGQYEDQYNCWPPAVIMLLITLAEVVIYCYDAFSENGSTYGNGKIGKVLIFDPWRRKECWRFVSYMFVHIGSVHLIVNCVIQVILGLPLEMVHKGARVTLVYVAGVLAGSLGTSIIEPNVKLAGASGGVYSLLAAHISTIIMNWKEMSYPLVQLLFWVILIGGDIGNVVYNKFYLHNVTNISYTAHYCGALAGLFVGITVLRNIEKHRGEIILAWITISLYTLFIIGTVIWNIFFPEYFPEQQV